MAAIGRQLFVTTALAPTGFPQFSPVTFWYGRDSISGVSVHPLEHCAGRDRWGRAVRAGLAGEVVPGVMVSDLRLGPLSRLTGVDFCMGTLTNKPAFHSMSPVRAREGASAS